MTHDEAVPEDLIPTLDPASGRIADLTRSLARRAGEEGLLDVGYDVVDSPIGSLLVAATEEGLVRLAFDCEDRDAVLEELASTVSPRVLESPGRLQAATRQLDEYFSGRRREFDLVVDLRAVSGFRREVLDRLRRIPFGSTATYAAIADSVGNPRAVRAVGSACARNPVPLVVPCHRVVRTDGNIGNYRGGTQAKRTLLEMESSVAGEL